MAAGVVFLHVAWTDFRLLRIRNTSVLVLIGLYGLFALSLGGAGLRGDLVAGGVLFVLGFVLWMRGMIGAGDAKLALPVGLFSGIPGVGVYVVALLIFSLIFNIIFRLSKGRGQARTYIGRRLRELADSGQVPYGVPMMAATGLALTLRVAVMRS